MQTHQAHDASEIYSPLAVVVVGLVLGLGPIIF